MQACLAGALTAPGHRCYLPLVTQPALEAPELWCPCSPGAPEYPAEHCQDEQDDSYP